MRARDYISYNTSSLKFSTEICATIDRFADLRDNLSKTNRCYKNHISTPDKWSAFIETCAHSKVNQENHWDFIQELKAVISSDESFTYLKNAISEERGTTVPTADEIRKYIDSQYENYPHEIIDDYLSNSINQSFAITLDNKEYTEAQEIDIYNSTYLLFDNIRKNLFRPRHASHIYKEFSADSEQIKDEVLRLLSYYIKNYDYDITKEQRSALNTIADQLGTYINLRLSKRAGAEQLRCKWSDLKTTLDNMISPEEKLKLLYSEKADYLQLSTEEQEDIDERFAEKCQIEIDKIEAIEAIDARTPMDYTEGPRTLKVVSDTLFAIFKEAKLVQTNDNTKISKIMGYITGFSSEKIRQRLSSSDIIPAKNKDEVDQANKLLSGISVKESIKINKK